ncbi:hypothetical protein G6F22_015551 [Rhizopus arrhizus]|nr:hypothetical protein G6F22_015551 [Rhizopus arrhizus]
MAFQHFGHQAGGGAAQGGQLLQQRAALRFPRGLFPSQIARPGQCPARPAERSGPAAARAADPQRREARARAGRVRRQGHVAERGVDALGRRIQHRCLGTAARVDVALRRPRRDAAAKRRHDAALAQQDAAQRIQLDAALALRDDARGCRRRDALHAEHLLPARRHQLDIAAEGAADARRAIQRDVALIRARRRLREQRGDRLAAPQVAAAARTGLVVMRCCAAGKAAK